MKRWHPWAALQDLTGNLMCDRRGVWGLLLGAWILWVEGQSYFIHPRSPVGDPVWAMLQAFETKRGCEAERTEYAKHHASLKVPVRIEGRTITVDTENRYSCWPDTIDPRTK
jgi:hypothetical protein